MRVGEIIIYRVDSNFFARWSATTFEFLSHLIQVEFAAFNEVNLQVVVWDTVAVRDDKMNESGEFAWPLWLSNSLIKAYVIMIICNMLMMFYNTVMRAITLQLGACAYYFLDLLLNYGWLSPIFWIAYLLYNTYLCICKALLGTVKKLLS